MNFSILPLPAVLKANYVKKANWEKAYLETANGKEWIVVPLVYEKDYQIKSTFSGDHSLKLEDQSKLYVYKSANGVYNAEILTYAPTKSFIEKEDRSFSGMLYVTSWDGAMIRKLSFLKGEKVPFGVFKASQKSHNAVGREQSDCSEYTIVTITATQNGVTIWSVEITYCSKTENEGFPDPNEPGGGSTGSTALYKPQTWVVQQRYDANFNLEYQVVSYCIISGIKATDGTKSFYGIDAHAEYMVNSPSWYYNESTFSIASMTASTLVPQSTGTAESSAYNESVAGSFTFYISSVFP